MSVIYTLSEKCRRCYACVRNCPVKAIRIRQGQAEVVKERCVSCGTCVQVCSQGAKQYERGTGAVWNMLDGRLPVIALLDPSFPAAFPEAQPGQVVTALQKLGFSEVMEAAFGAELIAMKYKQLLERKGDKTLIVSQCPAVVAYVEKHHPELIPNLAPIVSPMIAMGRLIKQKHNPAAKVVFIGPCIARKNEAADEKVAGAIDAVLAFVELREMLSARGIDPSREPLSEFSGPQSRTARARPLYASFLRLVPHSDDSRLERVIVARVKEYAIQVFRDLAEGHIRPPIVDAYFCPCIDSPFIGNELSFFQRRELIANYAGDQTKLESDEGEIIEEYADIDLRRSFTAGTPSRPHATEQEIEEVLARINRAKPEDRLDCGACGYNTCREMAIAICQGLAEDEMCWPYLIERSEATQQELIQTEKLTSLGQIAAAIAHEINNPLAGVLIYIKLLLKRVGANTLKSEDLLSYLPKMESEISRCSGIIRNLLDFARQKEPMFREVNINQVLENAFSLVAHQAQMQNIEVRKELSPSLPVIVADPDQLQQVCTNLVLNAIQAMPQSGMLTLRTATFDDRVKIDIGDTGCGIPKENLPRLFTPFFTTKERGKGVGLGLAVVHGIIERHKGKIEVQSEVGKGTTFSIYLGVSSGEEDQNPGR